MQTCLGKTAVAFLFIFHSNVKEHQAKFQS